MVKGLQRAQGAQRFTARVGSVDAHGGDVLLNDRMRHGLDRMRPAARAAGRSPLCGSCCLLLRRQRSSVMAPWGADREWFACAP